MEPVRLAANTPRSFYRGAGRIHGFRGLPVPDDPYFPEDWVGSTTTRYGQSDGLAVLPDGGGSLADAIAGSPEEWLGPAHVARFGADPAVLVKLLDAGERLPLHVHPDRRFALTHLGSPYGKTEAWVIVDAGPDAYVHLGFARPIEPDELAGWVRDQRVPEMLAATNRIPVRRGDAVLVPAGLPHAIGPGVFLVEAQEPTDLSVLLEHDGFDVPSSAAYLGLDPDEALACVDRDGWGAARLAELRLAELRRAGGRIRPGVQRLLPPAADGFFAAERLRPDPVSVLDPGFSIVIVLSGRGTLGYGDVLLPVARGDTLVVPYAAGPGELRGEVEAVRCRPPSA
jgi:mannose-6-phosphate isomerase